MHPVLHDVDHRPAIKQGLWFYGGVTPCHVRIVRHHTLVGTGDADDPPDLANDRAVECFYVRFDHPHTGPGWHDGGAALSLREAVFMAERRLGPLGLQPVAGRPAPGLRTYCLSGTSAR